MSTTTAELERVVAEIATKFTRIRHMFSAADADGSASPDQVAAIKSANEDLADLVGKKESLER